MNKPIRRACMVLILMCTVACGSDANRWPEQTGQVLDEVTGEPIEDADVIAFFIGTASYATQYCVNASSTKTDGNGKYYFPAWVRTSENLGVKDQHIQVKVYKDGYQVSEEYSSSNVKTHKLKQVKRTTSEKIKTVLDVFMLCDETDGVESVFTDALHSKYIELRDLATTEDEKRLLDLLLNRLEVYLYGYNKAMKLFSERSRK